MFFLTISSHSTVDVDVDVSADFKYWGCKFISSPIFLLKRRSYAVEVKFGQLCDVNQWRIS